MVMLRCDGRTRSPDIGATGVAGAGFDCGGGVLACLPGQPGDFGPGVSQVGAYAGEFGAQLRVHGLEGAGALGLALSPGRLPLVTGQAPGSLWR
jgi:hypothetical protein